MHLTALVHARGSAIAIISDPASAPTPTLLLPRRQRLSPATFKHLPASCRDPGIQIHNGACVMAIKLFVWLLYVISGLFSIAAMLALITVIKALIKVLFT
jgi:hypothetical protein